MQKNNDLPFCALTVKLYGTGKKAPKYEYSASATKSMFTCSLSKQKYSISQYNDWLNTPAVQQYVMAGYVPKFMTRIVPANQNTEDLVEQFSIVMIKQRPQRNVDGFKPIAQTMPQYKEMPMTEAQPASPDHAKPVENMSDMDDEIPF